MENVDIMLKKIELTIESLRAKKISAYRMCKETNYLVSQTSLFYLRDGKVRVQSIKFTTAQALLEWFDANYDRYK